MNEKIYDVIIVGAGFSGLSASYYLQQHGFSHLVFERGRTGDSWRTQRWDAFRLNSTSKLNLLPGLECDTDPDAFETAPSLVASFEKYIADHKLPVIENSKVIAVEKKGLLFNVSVSSGNENKKYSCKQVLIASGASNVIEIPSLAGNIFKEIKQLHTSEYRNSVQLSAGAILVVGSAQSGVQITEDLLNAGRKVYLSTSKVGRMPRWYRGKDIFYWLREMKFYERTVDEIDDPKLLTMRPPQISGTGSGRDTISLQSLAKKGAIILGKMDGADGSDVFFQLNAAEHVKHADVFSTDIKRKIDDYIIQNDLQCPSPHYDEADIPDTEAACACNIDSLNFREQNITTIIWSTGFNNDFSYIKLPVFTSEGKLIHKKGITEVGGLHFLGYPLLRSMQSTILFGILEDVKFVIENVCKHAGKEFPSFEPLK